MEGTQKKAERSGRRKGNEDAGDSLHSEGETSGNRHMATTRRGSSGTFYAWVGGRTRTRQGELEREKSIRKYAGQVELRGGRRKRLGEGCAFKSQGQTGDRSEGGERRRKERKGVILKAKGRGKRVVAREEPSGRKDTLSGRGKPLQGNRWHAKLYNREKRLESVKC